MLREVEGTADDLLDDTLVQIDAWPESATTSLSRHFEYHSAICSVQHLKERVPGTSGNKLPHRRSGRIRVRSCGEYRSSCRLVD